MEKLKMYIMLCVVGLYDFWLLFVLILIVYFENIFVMINSLYFFLLFFFEGKEMF